MKRREDVKMVSINSLENSMSSGSLGFYPAIIYAGRGNLLVKIFFTNNSNDFSHVAFKNVTSI